MENNIKAQQAETNSNISDNTRQNPFFSEDYGTPHNTAPFTSIRLEDYEPAFMEGIRRDDEMNEQIINNPEEPTFDNTIAWTVPENLIGRV